MNEQQNTIRIYSGVLITLLILSFCVPKGSEVLWINGQHSSILDLLMRFLTHLGDGLIFIPIIILLLFAQFRHALTAAIIGLAHGVVVAIAKRVLFQGAPRPKMVLDNDLLHFVPGVNVHAWNSFPSGHTATAFCLALFVALLFKNRWITLVVLFLALMVGYSRIYLLQHFLHDVAAGAVLGSATTFIIWQLLHPRLNRPWMELKLSVNLKKSKQIGSVTG